MTVFAAYRILTPMSGHGRVFAPVAKHLGGKHNQKTHGRGTPARAAYQGAYRQARAGGASVSDARATGRAAAGEVRVAERAQAQKTRTERLQTQAQRARQAASSGQVTEAQKARMLARADRLEARARGERVGPTGDGTTGTTGEETPSRARVSGDLDAEARFQEERRRRKDELARLRTRERDLRTRQAELDQQLGSPRAFRTVAQADKYHRDAAPLKPTDLSRAEDVGLRSYQGYGYETINGRLRGGGRPDAEERAVIAGLDSALRRSRLREPVETYRGMVATPGSPAANLLNQLRPGATFTDKAYTSTTVDPKGVDRFLGNLGPQPTGTRTVKMKVRLPAGTPAVYLNAATPPRGMTNFTKEYELLVARGGTYRVIGRTDRGTTTEIEVEYVP